MIHDHNLRNLTQNKNGYIAYCDGCQRYNVAYKNTLFIFNETELKIFREVLTNRIGVFLLLMVKKCF